MREQRGGALRNKQLQQSLTFSFILYPLRRSCAPSLVPAMSNGTASSSRVTISGTGIDSLYDTRAESDAAASSSSASAAVSSAPSGLVSPSLRELGVNGVWSVSSAKLGNGVDQLRDDDIATFWQSDGTLPHTITCQFHKKTRVECVAIYADQKMDESYAPSKISIRVGSGAAGAPEAAAAAAEAGDPVGSSDSSLDWREIDRFDLVEPQGWIICHLRENGNNDDAAFGGPEQQE